MKFNLKGVSKGTWIRIGLFVLATVNGALELAGASPLPFTDVELSQFISFGFMAITSIIGFWKNNSFTQPAQTADEYLKRVK